MSGSGAHIFICHSSKDAAVAREVVDFLEAEGLKCWISSRDVAPGHNYQESIVDALEASRGIIFLFSESSSKSGEIKKELSIGGSIDVPVFPLRLSPITPSGALRYELATRQWIDIFPDQAPALAKLTETIRATFNADRAPGAAGTPVAAIVAAPAAAAPQPAPPPVPVQSAAAATPLVAPGSAAFEAIRVLLARHVGPIAKVYVTKAANEARSPDEFCERLAVNVAAPAERAAFTKSVRAQLANHS